MTLAFFWEGPPVREVRPRNRKAVERVREIQGMLAMQSSGSETDREAGTEPDTTEWRKESGGLTPPLPTPTPLRAERTTIDVDATDGGPDPGPPVKPLPYRSVLAAWPDEWRERWGRRANDWEARGLGWRDAEGRAFLEVWNDWRATADVVERN